MSDASEQGKSSKIPCSMQRNSEWGAVDSATPCGSAGSGGFMLGRKTDGRTLLHTPMALPLNR